jgi:predicted transcriptional regulator of viral defense system
VATTQEDKILELIRQCNVIRPRDIRERGLPGMALQRLLKKGKVQKVERGLYVLANSERVTEFQSFAEACKRVPQGIICLLSALVIHGITTQLPSEIWMAIHRKTRRPKIETLPLQFIYLSDPALSEGIETLDVEGASVPVFCLAKTVADCFKYRNKIGLDVALEALREARKSRKCTMDEIWRYAKICRVSNVMRPYLEVIQ